MDVQYYDHLLEKLVHPQIHKIKKFLAYGCIEKRGTVYVCKPIKGYNTRTYTISINGAYHCNCQGFKKRGDCSHVQAVKIFRGGKTEEQMEFV